MIEKLREQDLHLGYIEPEEVLLKKTNELVDAVNRIMTWRFETDEDSDWYDDPKHREQPADPYAEQRKWIGKLCWFWNKNTEEDKRCKVLSNIRLGEGYKYYDCDCIKWKHCEPVKPDDDIIYKGGDNE